MTDQTVIPPARTQHRTMIRNLIPRLPERGHIKIGELGETRKSQKGGTYQLPVKLSFFKVTTLERGQDGNFVTDEDIHRVLGSDKPTEIPIRLLYDDISLDFPTRYACYIGKTLWCSGDGESALRISAKPEDTKRLPEPLTVSCPCHRQDPAYKGQDKCKINGRLSALIEGAGGVGGVWVFRTTSFNSVSGILSSLAFLRQVTGGILANIPLRLRLQPKQAANPSDGSAVLIYVVSVEFAGDIAELQHTGHQIALDRATTHVSIANIEEEARRMLALPGPQDAALPGDVAEDIVAEFYPEQTEEMLGATPPPRPTREQFEAKPGDPPHDPNTGEIIEEPEPEIDSVDLLRRSIAAARDGVEAFRTFWGTLTKPERAAINPDRTKYQKIAENFDAARQAEEELRDPAQSQDTEEPTRETPSLPDQTRKRWPIFTEDSWTVDRPTMANNKAVNWPALRDTLCEMVEQCESLDEITKFEADNAEHIALMTKDVAVYASSVTAMIASCRQRLDPGGK